MSANAAYASIPARNLVQFGGTAVTSRIPTASTNMSRLVHAGGSGTLITRIRVMPTGTITNPGCVTMFIVDSGASTVFDLFRDIPYVAQTPSTTAAAQAIYDERWLDAFVLKSTQDLWIASTVANTLAAHVEAFDL